MNKVVKIYISIIMVINVKKYKSTFILKKILFCFLILIQFIYITNKLYATNKEFTKIDVPSALVMDMNSGRILFDKNGEEKRPMASLTKIMTSILLVENCDLDELIEVPKEAAAIGGSTAGIKKGDKVSARSLLYGMMLPSRK